MPDKTVGGRLVDDGVVLDLLNAVSESQRRERLEERIESREKVGEGWSRVGWGDCKNERKLASKQASKQKKNE